MRRFDLIAVSQFSMSYRFFFFFPTASIVACCMYKPRLVLNEVLLTCNGDMILHFASLLASISLQFRPNFVIRGSLEALLCFDCSIGIDIHICRIFQMSNTQQVLALSVQYISYGMEMNAVPC